PDAPFVRHCYGFIHVRRAIEKSNVARCRGRQNGRMKGTSPMLWNRLRLTLDMIKFEHSVFALPFAMTGALLAFRESGFHEPDLWRTLLWIVVAMVGALSAAMAFNRLVDSEID